MAAGAPSVCILMGSKGDWDILQHAQATLREFGVACESRVLSAHRTPDALVKFVRDAEARGTRVFIAAAGMAAHLAGVVAAHTTRPVLGVPLSSEPFEGLDSLLATVQMPRGVPVATFAVGKHGAINAALFAVQILATGDEALAKKFQAYRQAEADKVLREKVE